MATFAPDRLLRTLTRAGVDFVVIGGVALTLHGGASMTQDLDILYRRSRENVGRLASALAGLEVRPRDFPDELPFYPDARALGAGTNFTFTTRLGWLDCLAEVAGIDSYDGVRERAVVMHLGRDAVNVASIGDLIQMKSATGRAKDIRPLQELEELRRLAEQDRA